MNTILVTSDFSKNATVALRYAIRLSELMKYRLVVFHCTNQSPYILANAKGEVEMEKLINTDEKKKTKLLKQKVKSAYKYIGLTQIPSSTIVYAQFNPMFIEKTLEVANNYKASLIVMGTHGASGFNKLFFGSNTSIMISKSEIPVLAVPEIFRYQKIKTLLYASDLENITNELPKVIAFAKPLNAAITILNLDYGIDYANTHFKKTEKAIATSGYNKIRILKIKATDKPLLRQVREYLKNKNEEWLVMFTKKRSFWDKIVSGSKAVEFSMKLPLPLLSIKKKEN